MQRFFKSETSFLKKNLYLSQIENRRNSALVQCELYRILTNDGYVCYPEARSGPSRFDLVVCIGVKVVMIIECKDSQRSKINTNTRQHMKYIQFNADLLYCLNMEQVPETVNIIKSLHPLYV